LSASSVRAFRTASSSRPAKLSSGVKKRHLRSICFGRSSRSCGRLPGDKTHIVPCFAHWVVASPQERLPLQT